MSNEVVTSIEARPDAGQGMVIRLTIDQPETEEPTMRLVMERELMIKMLYDLLIDLQALRGAVPFPSGPGLN